MIQVVGETRQTSRPRSNLQSVSVRLISKIRIAMNQAVDVTRVLSLVEKAQKFGV